jgi:hypothetical protein
MNDRCTQLYQGPLSPASSVPVPELLEDQSPDLGSWAAWYAAIGLPIFPCNPRNKDPRTAHGYKDATTDPERIASWWEACPEANIGCALAPARLGVVDLDGPQGIVELKTRLGADAFPVTSLVVRTGRLDSGWHLYYHRPAAAPPARRTKRGASKKYDLLCDGYVILPPSLHESGNRYTWVTWDSFQQSVLEGEAA